MRLEDLKADMRIAGLFGNAPVTIVAVKWHATYHNRDAVMAVAEFTRRRCTG